MTAESGEAGGATVAPPEAAGAEAAPDAPDAPEGPRLGSRAPAFVQRSGSLHAVWRGGVFVVGLAVVAGGVVLLPLPGPGWLVIFGGMAIWGTEFAWAQRVLFWTKQKAGSAARAAKRRFKSDEKAQTDD
jgi:uncharacterized protein (TIGR02611 family)